MQIFRDGAANPLKCSGEILVDHTVPPFAGRGTGPPDGITRARVVVSFEPILDRFGELEKSALHNAPLSRTTGSVDAQSSSVLCFPADAQVYP